PLSTCWCLRGRRRRGRLAGSDRPEEVTTDSPGSVGSMADQGAPAGRPREHGSALIIYSLDSGDVRRLTSPPSELPGGSSTMSNPSESSRKTAIDRRQFLPSATALVAAAAFLGALSPTPATAQGPNTDGGKAYLFPDDFKAFKIKTSGAQINGVIGG